ncbi:MAG: aromatic ring-hydroxylating dioxygenase subunit alpha [Gammaproteobacteria bacterium]|nr:aromatic ring-hydroxylating dioxygenase subunit alpha [Gammaproteobacteria bacterium]
MRAEERQRLLGILKHGLEHGGAVHGEGIVRSPLRDFTCPELLADERRVFFRETPLFMGLSADLPGNGSYWADSQTGSAILMTRDGAGRFRAFANSCRHRGAQVVPDGRGKRARFPCPFHAWTYDSGGDLIAVSRADRFGDIDKKQHGLVELPASERHGMLWVRPAPGAEIDVDACLEGLVDDMAHWALPGQVYVGSQVLEARMNWKLAIDTFGENYHFDVLHRETLASDIRGNLQTHDVFGSNYRMVFASIPGFSAADTDTLPVGEWPFRSMTLSVYFVYPNTIFLVTPEAVHVVRIFPDGEDPGRSRTAHSLYVSPEAKVRLDDPADTEWTLEGYFQSFNHVVFEEDYRTAEATQRTAEAGVLDHILFGRNEPALPHYHNAHRRGLGRPLLQAEPA